MKILVVNDDGIKADGIKVLAHTLAKKHTVKVIAPDNERSATSHSITLVNTIKFHKSNDIEGIESYQITGTPADCVKFGLSAILPNYNPDIIISGINKGQNLGNDVIYSGTVSAAIEGILLGYNAIAMSVVGRDHIDYTVAADFIASNLDKIRKSLSTYILNINVPNIVAKDIQGVKFCRLGIVKYNDSYVEYKDPFNNPFYLLKSDSHTINYVEDTDLYYINKNFITITPLSLDLTNYKELHILLQKKIF